MKRWWLCLFVWLLVVPGLAAQQTGTWTFYQAFNDARQVVVAGDRLYARFAGNVLCYDPATQEIKFLSKNDGLSGSDIVDMAYSSAAHRLILVYADLSIDLLGDGGSVSTFTQIRDAAAGAISFNGLNVVGTEAFVGVSDGLVVLNLRNEEIAGYYRFGHNVLGATRVGNLYYAGTADGLFFIGGVTANLSDPSQWHKVADAVVDRFLPAGDGLYCYGSGNNGVRGLWWMKQATSETDRPMLTQISPEGFLGGYADGDEAMLYDGYSAVVFANAAPLQVKSAIKLPTVTKQMALASGGVYWAACGMNGLKACKLDGTTLTPTGALIGGYGPLRDYCYNLHYVEGRLLVAGGRLDPFDRMHYPATIMTYDGARWGYVSDDGISEATGYPYQDVTCVVQDPADSTHLFAATGGTGLYEFRSGRLVKNYTINNSPLRDALRDNTVPESARRRYVRVDGLNFDAAGNLWMVNDRADSVICILKTDGTWARLDPGSGIRYAPMMERTMFDSKGRFWVTSRRSVSETPSHTAGLLCIDYNGTIDNTSDDVYTYRSSAYNEDGTNCDLSGGVNDLVQDRDGAIWVGTSSGLYVIDDPDTWRNTDFRLTQIKVPRNDGTNYADYLLSGVPITCIDVDGANRKWIGTANNGVYLVSADGLQVIHHFLAAESPLPSDNVYDIAINQATGEVMIGTDAGLCSYMGDATAPAEGLEKSAVRIYPNPVRPEFVGNVTITGLTADADIKITTTGGQAVFAGHSAGGTFMWNCRRTNGARVASGVYYVMVANADGKSGIVAKIVII